jgi:hypothetical protein
MVNNETAATESSDTELELTADDLVSLSASRQLNAADLQALQAASNTVPQQSKASKLADTSKHARAISRGAMFIGLMFAAGAAAIAMYTHAYTASGSGKRIQHLWKPAFPQPTHDTQVREPEPVEPRGPPVRYANPFDSTEVFEFPPGTSRAAARDAVAQILLERAAERASSVRQ